MPSAKILGCLLLSLSALACGGADGPKPLATGGSPGSGGAGSGGGPGSGGAGSGGTSGSGGAMGGAQNAPTNQVAFSVELSDTACADQTSWAWPDLTAPVTATERGTLGADQGPGSGFHAHCLVEHEDDGSWHVDGFMDAYDGGFLGVTVDPAGLAPAEFQLAHTRLYFSVRGGFIGSGPCLATLLDVSEGQAWGKIECATTQERDQQECGATVVYFAFEDCYLTQTEYLRSP